MGDTASPAAGACRVLHNSLTYSFCRDYIVTVLELVGGAPGGETSRVADSPAARASFITEYLYYIVTVLELVGGAPAYLSFDS